MSSIMGDTRTFRAMRNCSAVTTTMTTKSQVGHRRGVAGVELYEGPVPQVIDDHGGGAQGSAARWSGRPRRTAAAH